MPYNLIISTTRVVGPRTLLHHPPRHGLEIHQVVTLLQNWHALNPALSFLLFGCLNLVLFLDCAHVHFAQMLGFIEELIECVGWVDWLVFFCRVSALQAVNLLLWAA